MRSVDVDVSVSINGAPPVSSMLRHGYANFGDTCDASWSASDNYGRLCLTGTTAPFYNAFSAADADLCPESDEKYDAIPCGPARQFTIGVR